MLKSAGLVRLEQRITALLPRLPNRWREITVHHLLTHTSGIGHWDDYPDISLFRRPSADILDQFAARPLVQPVGTTWRYSSPGYVILARLIEELTAQSYREFLEHRIFVPLSMTSTSAGEPVDVSRTAHGYVGSKRRQSFELKTVGVGAGDVWSTVDDLAVWHESLLRRRVLGENDVRLMFTRHADLPPASPTTRWISYGYGWFIADVGGTRMDFHTGGNAGFSTICASFPNDGISISVLSNDERTDARGLCMRLFASLKR